MMKDYYQKSMRALQLAGMSERTLSRRGGTIHAQFVNWSIIAVLFNRFLNKIKADFKRFLL